ncbi:phospholipase D-like domain-containing protein [Mesorhizobium sp. IMUNJ 23033]|uniref:phospholipase D-like domain-containing protein n=1 Tax=Mesorhizobium sp. IMUNJ 23033 TaxID=3378039 RepID=UPI00384C5325
MTVGDTHRIGTVASRIADASSADVRADINAMLVPGKAQPTWVKRASKAIEARVGAAGSAPAPATLEGLGGPAPPVGELETIVFAIGTPVFVVRNGIVDIDSARAEAIAWRKLLDANSATVTRTLLSVGRIDVENYGEDSPFVGTGWVIDDGLVVTNRHVATLFAEASGAGFTFRLGFDARRPIGVRVDFLEELDNQASAEIPVERIVWMAPEGGPDVAFLKLATTDSIVGRRRLPLSAEAPRTKLPVAVVGYPARDTRFSDIALAEKIFGGVFDKKRVAVGTLLGANDEVVTHSCSTLGGNSGSPVVDIGTGEVVGLHYRGVEFVENDAVPAAVVKRCLARARALLDGGSIDMAETKAGNTGTITAQGSAVSITIPLKITVELGGTAFQATVDAGTVTSPAATVSTAAPADPGAAAVVDQPRLMEAVRKARALLANRDDVVAIKPGYRFENGEITDQRAVVISVKGKVGMGSLQSRGVVPLPSYIDGVRTDVTVASTADLMGESTGDEAPKTWHTNYQPRPDLPLDRRKAQMGFVIHSGPDAGWPQLQKFLSSTKKSLAIAMYEFGAPHVVEGVLNAVNVQAETIAMVLQLGGNITGSIKKDDFTDVETVEKIRDKKGAKFQFAAASTGKNGIFDSAYHIKVAVRDHASVWLSSGSWQSSNQPNVDPIANADEAGSALRLYNREWHVILDNDDLATLFEEHILRDLADAKAVPEAPAELEPIVFVPADMVRDQLEASARPRYFKPLAGKRSLDVHPVLTPDNYIATVVPFIQSARRTVYFQNQSFNTKTIGGDYRGLLDTLLAKQREGLDVRIIFRSFGSDDRDTLTGAKDFGFDMSWIRSQKNCHTKGIIIDGEAVLVGSHNWTTSGTGFNRDASLIFYDRDIARFYEELFLYDWGRIGKAKLDESLPPPIIMTPGTETTPPVGYVAVPLATVLGR